MLDYRCFGFLSLLVFDILANAFPHPISTKQSQPGPVAANASTTPSSFEELVVSGINYMASKVGTSDYLIYTVFFNVEGWRPAHRASDMNLMTLYMTPGAGQAIDGIQNLDQGQIDRWVGPIKVERRLELVPWAWNLGVPITLQSAFDLLADFGAAGPWKQVILGFSRTIPTMSVSVTEPYYMFVPFREREFYFVGSRTGHFTQAKSSRILGEPSLTETSLRRHMRLCVADTLGNIMQSLEN